MKKIILIIVFLFSIVSFSQENLIYKEGNYKVEIKLENNVKSLKLNKINHVEIATQNIEVVNMNVVGKNISIKKGQNSKNNSYWTISPNKEDLVDGFYKLIVTFRGRKGKLFQHEFLISVVE